jgi:hypothetical protein
MASAATGHYGVRLLAIGLGIAVIEFVITAEHVIFLPLLFLPFGLFSLGQRRRRRQSSART